MCALAEDLEFPLAFSHFSVDTFVVDACIEAKVEVLFNNCASNVADLIVASATVVRALWARVTLRRPAEWLAVLHEEIFLLQTNPKTCVFCNCSTCVGWVWCAVWHHDFTHYQEAVLA